MTENQAPAGWYQPDPAKPSELRYWDGSQWTDHTHTQATAVTDGGPKSVRLRAGASAMEAVGESYHSNAIRDLFVNWGLADGGVKNCDAVLEPEPRNRYDKNAVKVVIDGRHVGYVPSEEAREISREIKNLGTKAIAYTPARAWARRTGTDWHGRITLSFSGEIERERDYADERKAQERTDAGRKAGSIGGNHWSVSRPMVQELKRQERFDEARTTLVDCMSAAEREAVIAGGAPHSWPTDQFALVCRKLKDGPAELAALERYAALCADEPVPDKIAQQLMKARVAAGGAA